MSKSNDYYHANKHSPEFKAKIAEARKRTYEKSKTDPVRWQKKMCSRSKGRAKALGLDFDLTYHDIVVPSHCPITLHPLIPGHANTIHRPALDRLDNNKGYVKGNVRVISQHANTCKNDLTNEQIERLYLYSIGKLS